jgi:general L-amino acid transport system permease protein
MTGPTSDPATWETTGTGGKEPYPGHRAGPDDDDRRRPPAGPGPAAWAKANLFNSRTNSVITVVLAVVTAFLAFHTARWVFTVAEWEPVQRNLTLFMTGQFDRDEQWRLVVSALLIAGAVGLGVGLMAAGVRQRAQEDDLEHRSPSPWSVIRRFWPALAFVTVVLAAARTAGPFVLVGAAAAVGITAWALGRVALGLVPRVGWGLVVLAGLASFQVVSGTGGNAYLGPGLVFAYWLATAVERLAGERDLAGPVVAVARVAAAVAGMVAARLVYQFPVMDFGGVRWIEWGGLHLSLFVTVVCIVLAFPIGLILALGRRSSFPAFRWLTIVYIEIFRGVPLIAILFMAQFFIGFFLGGGNTRSLTTRAIIGITMFTAAYIAEIVRGGLLAVPAGQVEAGQALGLPAQKVTRLIVLPQALRAVIPAMVGQFISLFKDTSLLTVIGFTEFLGVRELVHAQTEFRIGFQEMTLVFIAFGYWAISYTMSRESRRLESKLGVGVR